MPAYYLPSERGKFVIFYTLLHLLGPQQLISRRGESIKILCPEVATAANTAWMSHRVSSQSLHPIPHQPVTTS